MLIVRLIAWLFSVGMMAAGLSEVSGQVFPHKPIRIITGSGGSVDLASRLIAQGISDPLGQPVIVENRATTVLAELVSKSLPDGYTLLVIGGALWITPLLQKMPYDAVRDFSPVTIVNTQANVLVVHPSVAANSVKELIALAKTKPGELNYGSSSSGSSTHLAGELFKAMAGVNIVRVPYKSSSQIVIDLLAGRVELALSSASSVMLHTKTGKLRALAVTSAKPSALAPGLPTIADSGLPGYEMVSLDAMFVPAKTPEGIVKRLNQEIVRVLNQADVKEKLLNAGVEVVASSPKELATAVKSDIARWGKLIKDAGITAE